jgi:hypothetical protein
MRNNKREVCLKSNGLRNRYPGGWPCREIGYHMRPSTVLSGKTDSMGVHYTATAVTVSSIGDGRLAEEARIYRTGSAYMSAH